MAGFEFVLNLFDTLPGTVVYHLLILLGMLAAAGIVLTEWRQTRNPDLKPFVLALSTILILRVFAVFLAPFNVDVISPMAAISAPFLYAVELLSILLLLWAFGSPLWGDRTRELLTVIFVVWALFLTGAALSWYGALLEFPVSYTDFWQVPIWYAVFLVCTIIGGAFLWRNREQVGTGGYTSAALLILGLGSLCGFLGSVGIQPVIRSGEGVGRLLMLVAYPLFAVALYQSALQDLQAYRADLQDLSQQALRQSQELLFLVEATRSIGESLDLEGMLGEVVEHVAMALHSDRAAILLKHEEEELLTVVAQYEVLGTRYSPPQSISLEEYPLLGFVMQEGQVVYRKHEDFTPVRPLFKLLKVHDEGPILLQPLTRQQRTVGVVVACNDHSGTPFTPEEERLATTIAVQIAGAVENSRLYREVQAKAYELGAYLALREEELRRQEAIFESMVEGLVVSDARGRVILMNEAAEEILGTARDVVLEQDVSQLVRASSLESSVDARDLISLEEPLDTLLDVGERKVRVNAAPVRMDDGTRLGVAALMQDVTREYLAEEAKREFIASISHELRTPLTAIKGYAEILMGDVGVEIPAPVRRFVGVIQGNAARMNFIINNLIAVAALERGRFGLNYQKVELRPLLREVLGRYEGRLSERNLSLQLDLPEDLPTVEIDPNRIQQVLDNLLSNAVKFTHPGGHVTVGARTVQDSLKEPKYFSVWVSDTGVGIPTEEQVRIWERFYRADNPLSLEAGGLGIGLTIAQAMVKAHGGRIWVDSAPEEGSTFTVLLPITRRHSLPDSIEELM